MPWVETNPASGGWDEARYTNLFDPLIFDPAIFDVANTGIWTETVPAHGTWDEE